MNARFHCVLENRWRLFGHILRRDREIPANKAMEGFFIPQGDKYRGRPITTLPVVLNNDLSRLESNSLLMVLKPSKTLKTWKRSQNRGISGKYYAQEYKRQPRRCSLTTTMRNGDKSSKSCRFLTNYVMWLFPMLQSRNWRPASCV